MDGGATIRSSLIVVCCHAIYVGSSDADPGAGTNEDKDWLIEPFQKGETPTFIDHIREGVQNLRSCLDAGVDAILVFSGGFTKQSKGCDFSEGDGYLNLTLARNLFGLETKPPSLRQRIFAETYATDSYQNVLLSLTQYPLFVRNIQKPAPGLGQVHESPQPEVWPDELVIISHAFKRSRFLDLHIPTIQPPVRSVQYIGIDPALDEHKLAEIVEGDRLRGYGAWRDDLHGTGTLLADKRLGRGWDEAEFIDKVLRGSNFWDIPAGDMLAALVRGVPDAEWPCKD